MNIVIPRFINPCINALRVEFTISPKASLNDFVPIITSVNELDAVSLNADIPADMAFILPCKGVKPSPMVCLKAISMASLATASSNSFCDCSAAFVDLFTLLMASS